MATRLLPVGDWNDVVKAKLVELMDRSPLAEDETMRIIARLVLDRADLNFENGRTESTWTRRLRIQTKEIDPLTQRWAVRFGWKVYSHDDRVGMVGLTLGGILSKRERRTRRWVLRAIEECVDSGRIEREFREVVRRRQFAAA